jgi:PhnO protein
MLYTASDSLLIRPATRDDRDVVYEFLCELETETLNRQQFDACYDQNLANSMVHYLVAELPNTSELVGFVSCHIQYLLHHTGKVGEIQELFVKPAYRDQQIGKQLVRTLIELAEQQNLVNLEVTTNKKRLDAIRFYERELFEVSHLKLVRVIAR